MIFMMRPTSVPMVSLALLAVSIHLMPSAANAFSMQPIASTVGRASQSTEPHMVGIEQQVCEHGCPGSAEAVNCTSLYFKFDHCYDVAAFNSSPLMVSHAIMAQTASSAHTQFRPTTCDDRRRSLTTNSHPLPPHFTFRYASVPSNAPEPNNECPATGVNYTSPVIEKVGDCFPFTGGESRSLGATIKFILNRCWMEDF